MSARPTPLELQLEQLERYGTLKISKKEAVVVVHFVDESVDPGAFVQRGRFDRVISWEEVTSIHRTIELNYQANGRMSDTERGFEESYLNAGVYIELLDYLYEYGNGCYELDDIRFRELRASERKHVQRVTNLVELIESHQRAWEQAGQLFSGLRLLRDERSVNYLYDKSLSPKQNKGLRYPARPPFLSVENLISLSELRLESEEEFKIVLKRMFPNCFDEIWLERELAKMKQMVFTHDVVLITALIMHLLIQNSLNAKASQTIYAVKNAKGDDMGAYLTRLIPNRIESDRTQIIKTKSPSHAIHAFWPSVVAILKEQKEQNHLLFYQTLLCNQSTDFMQYIRDIEFLTTLGGSSVLEQLFVVLLPEFLNDGQYESFVQYVRSRLVPIPDAKLPKLLIITSDPFAGRSPYVTDLEGKETGQNDYHDRICLLREVSDYLVSSRIESHLVMSELPGDGKTRFIREKYGAPCPHSVYINSEHQTIPPLEGTTHFQFSKEVLSHGIEFWERILMLSRSGWVFDSKGNISFIPSGGGDKVTCIFESPRVFSKRYRTKEHYANDFPFPCKTENVTKIDHKYPSQEPVSLDQCLSLFQNIKENCELECVQDYLDAVGRLFWDKEICISNRTLSYVRSYLVKYASIFAVSGNTFDGLGYVLLLTASAFYHYKELREVSGKGSDEGFVTVLVNNLFCDEEKYQKKPVIVTTKSMKSIFNLKEMSAELQDRVQQSLDVLSRGNILKVMESITCQEDRSVVECLISDVFCTSKQYKMHFGEMMDKERDISRKTVATLPYLFRFSVVVSRIHLLQPLLLTGDTGCGKTSLVSFVRRCLDLEWNKRGYELNTCIAEALNFHGNVCSRDFDSYLERIRRSTRRTVAFCDEVNTSNDSSQIEHLMLNWEDDLEPHMGFLGAVNVFSTMENERSRSLSKVGMVQLVKEEKRKYTMKGPNEKGLARDMSSFRYHVHKLESSSEQIQLDCNPMRIAQNEDEMYTLEEQEIVDTMIIGRCGKLPEESISKLRGMSHLSIRFIRNVIGERAVISYRDIERVTALANFLFDRVLEGEGDRSKRGNISVAITIVVLFCLRLPVKPQQVPRANIKNFPNIKAEASSEEFVTFSVRRELLSLLSERFIENIMTIFDRFAFWYSWKIVNNNDIWLFRSTVYHLAVMRLCVCCRLPCAIIGMPGTSKSYAVDLLESQEMIDDLYLLKYMSSRSSSAEGIRSEYYDAGYLLVRPNSVDDHYVPVLFIDEMGLANINPAKPLKFLHSILDLGIEMNDCGYYEKIATIGVSNYAMDFANMNRMVLVFTELPTVEELQRVFAFREFRLGNKLDLDEAVPANFDDFKSLDTLLGYLDGNVSTNGSFDQHNSDIREFFDKLWPAGIPNSISLRALYSLQGLLGELRKAATDSEKKRLTTKIGLELINAQRLREAEDALTLMKALPEKTNEFLSDLGYKWDYQTDRWKMFKARLEDKSERKALCVLTNGYSIVDYVSELSDSSVVLFAEDFQKSGSELTFEALSRIINMFVISGDSSTTEKLIIVGNHPVLDSILDLLNGYDDGHQVLIGSGFTTSVTLKRRVDIVLIAEFSELNDQQNPFSLPFLDRTQMDFLEWTDAWTREGEPICADADKRLLEISDFANEAKYKIFSLSDIIQKWSNKGSGQDIFSEICRNWTQGVRAVVHTKAKLVEKCVGLSVFEELFDDDFQSFDDLSSRLDDVLKKYEPGCEVAVIYKCSKFSLLHHQNLKYFFSKRQQNVTTHIFIVYYQISCDGASSHLPSTLKWPVFAIEDITKYAFFGEEGNIGAEEVDKYREKLCVGDFTGSEKLIGFIIENLLSMGMDVEEPASLFKAICGVCQGGDYVGFLTATQWKLSPVIHEASEVDSKHALLVQDVKTQLEQLIKPFMSKFINAQPDDIKKDYSEFVRMLIEKIAITIELPCDSDRINSNLAFMGLFATLCGQLITNAAINLQRPETSFLLDLLKAMPDDYIRNLVDGILPPKKDNEPPTGEYGVIVQESKNLGLELGNTKNRMIVEIFSPLRKVLGVNLVSLLNVLESDRYWCQKFLSLWGGIGGETKETNAATASNSEDDKIEALYASHPVSPDLSRKGTNVSPLCEEVNSIFQSVSSTPLGTLALPDGVSVCPLAECSSEPAVLLDMLLDVISVKSTFPAFEAALVNPDRDCSFLTIALMRFARSVEPAERIQQFRNICMIVDPVQADKDRGAEFIKHVVAKLNEESSSVHHYSDLNELINKVTKHEVSKPPDVDDAAFDIVSHICDGLVRQTPGQSPILAAVLRLAFCLKKYPYIQDLLRMVWQLRTSFTCNPAALGVVLNCCCLVGSGLLRLQNLPKFDEWRQLSIPESLPDGTKLTGHNAAFQINKILNSFLNEYNTCIESLSNAAHWKVLHVPDAFPECVVHPGFFYGFLSFVLKSDGETLEQKFPENLCLVTISPPVHSYCAARDVHARDAFGLDPSSWQHVYSVATVESESVTTLSPKKEYLLFGLLMSLYDATDAPRDAYIEEGSPEEVSQYFRCGLPLPVSLPTDTELFLQLLPQNVKDYIAHKRTLA